MIHPIALLYLLLRMVRAAQGVHASPDGYARGLSGEFRRRRCRSRRVRRYAERVPFALAEDEDDVGAEPARVSAPRRPVDTAGQVATAPWVDRVPTKTMASASASAGFGVAASPATVSVSVASVAVPAAIVRGRCFMTGRETGARPVESRKLALTVLCALADQEQAQASWRACAHAPGEGLALGQSPFLESSRLPRRGAFAGPFRPTEVLERSEHAEFTERAERAVLAGREAA